MAGIGRHIAVNAQLAGALAALAVMSGCAARPTAGGIAVVATPPTVAARPLPPAGASASQAIPPRAADGSYRTINTGLGPAATIWHVRSALNVAALGCRGEQEAAIIANYNVLLASKQSLLKAAFAQTEAEARKAGGADWRDVHDRAMTQTYNFFAQPPAKQRFCEVAAIVAAEAAAMPATAFAGFAAAALARLEAPFTDFYRAYDGYRVELARWEAGQSTTAPMRTALVPVTPAATIRVAIAPPAASPPVAGTPVTARPGPARLAYAPIDSVIAWTPDTAGDRLASAEDRRKLP